MKLDYEVFPLDHATACLINSTGAERVVADPQKVQVKAYIKHGDLYRQTSFICKQAEVGTKDFVINMFEVFYMLRNSIKAAIKNTKQDD